MVVEGFFRSLEEMKFEMRPGEDKKTCTRNKGQPFIFLFYLFNSLFSYLFNCLKEAKTAENKKLMFQIVQNQKIFSIP